MKIQSTVPSPGKLPGWKITFPKGMKARILTKRVIVLGMIVMFQNDSMVVETSVFPIAFVTPATSFNILSNNQIQYTPLVPLLDARRTPSVCDNGGANSAFLPTRGTGRCRCLQNEVLV